MIKGQVKLRSGRVANGQNMLGGDLVWVVAEDGLFWPIIMFVFHEKLELNSMAIPLFG